MSGSSSWPTALTILTRYWRRGGSVLRSEGRVQSIVHTERNSTGIQLTATGTAGTDRCSSRRTRFSARAGRCGVRRGAAHQLNDTTAHLFHSAGAISPPPSASPRRHRRGPEAAQDAVDYFAGQTIARPSGEPISPNIIEGGYRINVIPSEARATLECVFGP